jgi:hypothetical protein
VHQSFEVTLVKMHLITLCHCWLNFVSVRGSLIHVYLPSSKDTNTEAYHRPKQENATTKLQTKHVRQITKFKYNLRQWRRTTCTPKDGQLGQHMLCMLAVMRRKEETSTKVAHRQKE